MTRQKKIKYSLMMHVCLAIGSLLGSICFLIAMAARTIVTLHFGGLIASIGITYCLTQYVTSTLIKLQDQIDRGIIHRVKLVEWSIAILISMFLLITLIFI